MSLAEELLADLEDAGDELDVEDEEEDDQSQQVCCCDL